MSKQVILFELTLPYESRTENAHICETEKYVSLANSLMESGFQAKSLPKEVRAKGFVGIPAYDLMKRLLVSNKKRTIVLKAMVEASGMDLVEEE